MRSLNTTKGNQHKITDKDSIALKMYLDEIERIPLLDETELAYFCKLKDNGDQRGLDAIVKANLRFVVSVAKDFQFMGLSLEDLIDEGNLGLIDAVRKYDITKGFTVDTYAKKYIRGAILNAIEEHGLMIQLPPNKHRELRKYKKALITTLQLKKAEPTVYDIHYYMKKANINKRPNLGFTIKDLRKLQELQMNQYYHISLDAPISTHPTRNDQYEQEGSSPSRGDNLTYGVEHEETYRNANHEEMNHFLSTILSALSERDRDILKNEYGIGNHLTIEEIKAKYAIEDERIRQLSCDALVKLQRLIPLGRTRYSNISTPYKFLNNKHSSIEENKQRVNECSVENQKRYIQEELLFSIDR